MMTILEAQRAIVKHFSDFCDARQIPFSFGKPLTDADKLKWVELNTEGPVIQKYSGMEVWYYAIRLICACRKDSNIYTPYVLLDTMMTSIISFRGDCACFKPTDGMETMVEGFATIGQAGDGQLVKPSIIAYYQAEQ